MLHEVTKKKKKRKIAFIWFLECIYNTAFDSPPTKSAKSNSWAILGLVSTDWCFLDCESHFPVSCMSSNL